MSHTSKPAATKNTFQEAVKRSKLLLGMVHLKPLPGSPCYGGQSLGSIAEAARIDADRILEAGFDGYLVENFGDIPFHPVRVPPHVLAAMTRITLDLPLSGILVGVNVLRNDASGALAIAAACGLQMIRVNVHTGAMVTDQGVLQGQAAVTVRERSLLAPDVAILADVNVKHAFILGSNFDLKAAARDAAYRGLADAIIVTGPATGVPPAMADLKLLREALPDRPLLVGSGVRPQTVRETLRHCNGVIVGTAIKRDERVDAPVDPARVRRFVREARG